MSNVSSMRGTALVTGASSGIGEAAALRLKQAGFNVYAVARRVERMSGLADAGINVMKMDVTDDKSMVAGIKNIVAESGRVDVLVNNAGYGSYGAVEDVPLSEAKYQFDVNVFGLARLTQLVLPHMREQRSGRIINISSIGGRIYEPLGGWYHATKFAVEGLSDAMRMELRPFGIQVVIIEPAGIRTEWSGIAADNLRKSSSDSAYAAQAEQVGAFLDLAESPAFTSASSVVAKKIVKAATVRHPRTRYPVGKGAGSILFTRWLLPARAFDAMMTSTFGLAKRLARPTER
ncbi:MAG TPA: oxidoreductase [Mycobacteriales bacterium]|nr:oxidoreductase [Mycobacteriales bacterium]